MSFRDLKVGDKVIRVIGDRHFHTTMEGTVMVVEEKYLKVAMKGCEHWPVDELWTFNRDLGCEEERRLV